MYSYEEVRKRLDDVPPLPAPTLDVADTLLIHLLATATTTTTTDARRAPPTQQNATKKRKEKEEEEEERKEERKEEKQMVSITLQWGWSDMPTPLLCLTRLRTLVLRHGGLQTIPALVLPLLEHLDLSFQRIHRVQFAHALPLLRVLVLDMNPLRRLLRTDRLAEALPRLEELSVRATWISNLFETVAALGPLKGLRKLAFQGSIVVNLLKEFDFELETNDDDERDDDSGDEWMAEYRSWKGLQSLLNKDVSPLSIGANVTVHSPICTQLYYRMYVIESLPNLEFLDSEERISDVERQQSSEICAGFFEKVFYGTRRQRTPLPLLLLQRQRNPMPHTGKLSDIIRRRSVAQCMHRTTKMEPPLHNVSVRQFEYNPSIPGRLLMGTENGMLMVSDLAGSKDELVGYYDTGTYSNMLGLCWMHRHPTWFFAGGSDGRISLFDSALMNSRGSNLARLADFERFNGLTSVHVNSTSDYMLSSGYSGNIRIYDIATATVLKTLEQAHTAHVNVSKFASVHPSLFVTSSFDSEMKLWDMRSSVSTPIYTRKSKQGNIMACCSMDDRYILVSAVNNEVLLYDMPSGRLVREFEMRKLNVPSNFSRSYFMNGRDYIITGSCQEDSVRVYNTETGALLDDVQIVPSEPNAGIYVQSLRSNPHLSYQFSVLICYQGPTRVRHSETHHVDLCGTTTHSPVVVEEDS